MTAQTQFVDVTTDGDIADALGAARAKLKQAADAVRFLEDMLKYKGVTEANGEHYRVKIAYGIETKRVDWKAVADKLQPSRQLVQAHSKVTTSDRVTVSAHKKEV